MARRPNPPRRRLATLLVTAAAALAACFPATAAGADAAPDDTAFEGNGMWIWYVSKASSGSPSAIAERAREHRVKTVYVKSGDAGNYWSQFSKELVADLHERGLNVCAWQFVYGDYPKDEASAAAKAVRNGADCFVIDAETHYEGKYSQARTYTRRLRDAAGSNYPIGLASFPYTDYHPAFPYSVFLGPGGAQFNLPQAYWRHIGDGVDTTLEHTYAWNRPYGRPVMPLGQLYMQPPRSEIIRFRRYVRAARSKGVSWWSWQHANSSEWNAVGDGFKSMDGDVSQEFAELRRGARGDIVLWAQQHLRGAGHTPALNGRFGDGTARAVRRFQEKKGLPVHGRIDTATWEELLRYVPVRSSSTSVRGAGAGGRNGPPTAWLPARRYEIPPPAAR